MSNNPSSRFIVKVQLPVMSNVSDPQALVYDQRRQINQQFPVTEELKAAMGVDLKSYFWAHLDANKQLHLDERAKDQPW